MRSRSLLALPLVLALAGCTTTGPGGSVDDIVAQVQAAATRACGYLPLADTILGIAGLGQYQGATEIAGAICAAVSRPTLRGATVTVTVSGVAVKGSFVR